MQRMINYDKELGKGPDISGEDVGLPTEEQRSLLLCPSWSWSAGIANEEATLQSVCERADTQPRVLGHTVQGPTGQESFGECGLCCKLWFPC